MVSLTLKKYCPGTLSNVFNARISKLESVWDFLLFDAVMFLLYPEAASILLSLYNFEYAILSWQPSQSSGNQILELRATSSTKKADKSGAALFGAFQNLANILSALQARNSHEFISQRCHHPTWEKEQFLLMILELLDSCRM